MDTFSAGLVKKSELKISPDRALEFQEHILVNPIQIYETIAAELDGLKSFLSDELLERKCAFIPLKAAGLFECDELFGRKFHEKASIDNNKEIRFDRTTTQ